MEWSGKAVSKKYRVYQLKITGWQIKGKERVFVRIKIENIHYGDKRNYVLLIYRVSINSFPDYKHLLQENYLDMLEMYVAPQLEEFQPWIILQQDGAPHTSVSHYI